MPKALAVATAAFVLAEDVRADKAGIVSTTMALDATEAAASGPVDVAYESERQALGNQRLAVIQDRAEHFHTLSSRLPLVQ